MNTVNPEPESLTAQALALQAQQTEALEFMNRTLAGISRDPAEAYRTLPAAGQKCEDFYKSQEAFLGKMGEWGAQQLPQLRKHRADAQVAVLVGQGQAAIMLQKLPEARAHFEAALAIIGETPDPRRSMIRTSLAQLAAVGA